jgi:hypothetical protein
MNGAALNPAGANVELEPGRHHLFPCCVPETQLEGTHLKEECDTT